MNAMKEQALQRRHPGAALGVAGLLMVAATAGWAGDTGGQAATNPRATASNAWSQRADMDSALPALQHDGNVAYLTGGVGQRESDAMKQAMARYPLAVEIVQHAKSGHDVYTAGAQVQIRKPHGETVLATQALGPFVLADVPDGTYEVDVTLNGQTQHHQASVHGRHSAKSVFVFHDEG